MPKLFIKKVEDFICEHCGQPVKGNGYTNHCPVCLWGKHVDNQPGDRANLCHGLMKPESCERIKGGYSLVSVCQKCGSTKRNKLAPEDSLEEAIKIQKTFAER